jgi:hypothetical protein
MFAFMHHKWFQEISFSIITGIHFQVQQTHESGAMVNPRWTNVILYGSNRDTGTRPWRVEVNKQSVDDGKKVKLTLCLTN